MLRYRVEGKGEDKRFSFFISFYLVVVVRCAPGTDFPSIAYQKINNDT